MRRTLTCLAALAVGTFCFGGPTVAETAPDPYQEEYLEAAYQEANKNRYMVKADKLQTPSPNMEPYIKNAPQRRKALRKLRDAGYCVGGNDENCKQANILLIVLDDIGWSDFGPYGGGVAVGNASPAINRLAAEGMVLTSAYAQPSCSPTRATILTGQLPIHHGVLAPQVYTDGGGFDEDTLTLAQLLNEAGYDTQGVGKWHLGEAKDAQPQNLGFNDYYGYLSVSEAYTEWRDENFNPEVARDRKRYEFMKKTPSSKSLFHGWSGDREGDRKSGCANLQEVVTPLEAIGDEPADPDSSGAKRCKNGPKSKKKISIADLDQEWARYSEDFIRSHENDDQPWFLYHGTRGCHFDNYPDEAHKNASYGRTNYSNCAVELDEVVGRLTHALEDTDQAKDTFLFIISDNGPEQEVRPYGRTPFRGGKGSTWEGGVRVPAIAWWPGMIESGRSDGLFNAADLFNTSLFLAGFDVEETIKQWMGPVKKNRRYIYGIDQTSFLLGGDGVSNRRSNLYWMGADLNAVRIDELKLHTQVTLPLGLHQGNIGGFSGLGLAPSYFWLFNLHEDPQEQNNLYIRHAWSQQMLTGELTRFGEVLEEFPPK